MPFLFLHSLDDNNIVISKREIFCYMMAASAMMTGLTSANGLLSLLEEPEAKLKVYALEQLNNLVDEFWPEISDNIQQM